MNRDQYNDYEWYNGLVNHRGVSTSGRVYSTTGICKPHKKNKSCCVDLMVTIIVAVIFTVFMYVWLA